MVPRHPTDAQAWAEWLQWRKIDRFHTPVTLAQVEQEVAARFPYHQPRLVEAKSLLERAGQSPRERSSPFLLAPYDLGLWS